MPDSLLAPEVEAMGKGFTRTLSCFPDSCCSSEIRLPLPLTLTAAASVW
ncbi:hypothetical protein [Pantoea septica]|nr:hypothetical protein [Pantoea septica]